MLILSGFLDPRLEKVKQDKLNPSEFSNRYVCPSMYLLVENSI
jgi:hypothetical protein